VNAVLGISTSTGEGMSKVRVTGEIGMLYVWEMNLLVWTVSVLENGCAPSSSGWSVADKTCLSDDWGVWMHCGVSGVSWRAKGKDDWRRVSLSSSDS
jgi:hypothetical protein